MAASLNINDILSQVEKLNKEDQQTLLQRLFLLLKKSEPRNDASLKLTSISGLGKEIWKRTEIDKYIDEERQW